VLTAVATKMIAALFLRPSRSSILPERNTSGIEPSAAIVTLSPTSASDIARSATANSFQNVVTFCVHT
jgi:hypothetical protein